MQYTDSQFKFRIDVPAGWAQQPHHPTFAAGGGRVAFAHPGGGSVNVSCGPPDQGTPIDANARTKMLLEFLESVPERTGRPHRWMQPASSALNLASGRVRLLSSYHGMISIIRDDLEYTIQCRNTDAIALSMSNILYSFRFTDDVEAPVFKDYGLVGCVFALLATAASLALIWYFFTGRPAPAMESAVPLLAVAYICALNVAIGCYVGWFGRDGFARPRPIAYVIMLLVSGAGWLLVYAQNSFGFHAQAKHIIFGAGCFLAGFIGTKLLHARRG